MTQPSAEPWTIQRLLGWTAGHFEAHGRDAARLAAEVLLSEALGCKRIDLYARYGEVPGEPHLSRYRDWVKRHAAGEPVAYLVGYRDFYSLRFAVNSDVLIPRPETEQLVLETIGICQQRQSANPGANVSVLEIGTGSGCIAITLAKQLPTVRLTAVEVSAAALDIARKNAASHEVAECIEFLESDLDQGLAPDRVFDVIVSNPPYVGRSEKGTLDDTVREHEPALALYSGEDGMEITGRIIEIAGDRLVPGGTLIFETSPFIAARCADLIRQSGKFGDLRIIRDTFKKDRFIRAEKLT